MACSGGLTSVVVGALPACGRVVAVHGVAVVADAELEVDRSLTQSPRNHGSLQDRGEEEKLLWFP